MPIPATTGQFRTKLEDMEIGDYIAFKAVGTSGVPCVISELGAPLATAQANEIPLVGSATPSGYAYAVKADTGITISDRVVQHSVKWDSLNTAKLIQGLVYQMPSIVPKMAANTYGSITVSASNEAVKAAWFAFNGLPDTGWVVSNSIPAWLKIDFGSTTSIVAYNITTSDYDMTGNHGSNNPGTWQFQGSMDNITWDTLDSQTNVPQRGLSISTTYELAAPASYRYYRLYIVSLISGSNTSIGELKLFGSKSILVRSLTGGNAYLGTDGKASLTDKSLGAFPTNEWDKYIIKSNLGGKIIAGNDNVWHFNISCDSWCQDTPIVALFPSTTRTVRGYSSSIKMFTGEGSTIANVTNGFRPVFEFLETKSKASNLFY